MEGSPVPLMGFGPIFKSFVDTLNERLAYTALDGFRKISEDTICFYFAAALLKAGVSAHCIEMEVQHPTLGDQSYTVVDVRVAFREVPTIWIEVKFDKKFSKTKVGYVLNDLCRLGSLFKDRCTALMLYVAPREAEKELQKYLPNDGATPLVLDRLDEVVKKPLNMKVLQKIERANIHLNRIGGEEVGPLICLLYEVSTKS